MVNVRGQVLGPLLSLPLPPPGTKVRSHRRGIDVNVGLVQASHVICLTQVSVLRLPPCDLPQGVP